MEAIPFSGFPIQVGTLHPYHKTVETIHSSLVNVHLSIINATQQGKTTEETKGTESSV